jgi:hypothetical protein
VTISGALRARFYKTVAETSYDNADWTPLYHPTTAATAVNTFKFTMRFAALPSGANLYIRTTKSTSPSTAGTDILAALMVTTAGAFGTQAGAALLTMAINTDYIVIVTQIDNLHYDITVNGTLYDNGGAHWHNHENQTGWFTGFYFTGDTATLVDVSFHDLVTSWSTAGPDVATVEAYIDDEIVPSGVEGEATVHPGSCSRRTLGMVVEESVPEIEFVGSGFYYMDGFKMVSDNGRLQSI